MIVTRSEAIKFLMEEYSRLPFSRQEIVRSNLEEQSDEWLIKTAQFGERVQEDLRESRRHSSTP